MAFTGQNIDPGTSPSVPVAVEVINSKDYQAVKIVDATAGSETPTFVPANPGQTNDAANATANGAVGDAAWVSGNGSIIAILKGIFGKVAGTLSISGAVTGSGNFATTSAAASQADGHSATLGSTTDAAATTTGSVIAQLRRIANAVAGTLTVSGTVTTTPPSNASTNLAQVAGSSTAVGHGTAATALRVELPTDGTGVVGISGTVTTKETKSATGTGSNVAGSATSVTILASNANRLGATVFNDSTAILYIKFGTTASTSDFVTQLPPNAYYEVPFGYTGRIDGLWASAAGNARVCELT